MKTTRNFADVIRDKLKNDPKLAKEVSAEYFKADIGSKLYKLRKEHKLSRKKLAEIILCVEPSQTLFTMAQIIKDIEESNYEGDFLIEILLDAAFACGKRLEMNFVEG